MARTTREHYGNSLHVYCRLVDLGIGMKLARRICRLYERCWIYKLIYC